MKKATLKFAASAVLLLIIVYGAVVAVDWYVLSAWNTEDSSVVVLENVLERRRDGGPLGEDGWESEIVELQVRYRNGPRSGITEKVEIIQLVDSKLALKKGKDYLLLSDRFDDGTVQFSLSDRYRVPAVVGFIIFACGILMILSGISGVRALGGLFLSLIFLIWWFVPAVSAGFSPIPAAILSVAVVSVVTCFFVVRKRELRPIPILGSVGGVTGGYLTGWFMVYLWQLTGLESSSYAALLSATRPDLSLKDLLLAAVMIGAIGAVLDVAVSVTATMGELHEYDPAIPRRRLWTAGLRVGQDVLGSMINTLILAYLGSSLPFVVLIAVEGVDFIALMNDPAIAQEILRSVSGTVGLLLTIPITAAIGAWWICRGQKSGRPRAAD